MEIITVIKGKSLDKLFCFTPKPFRFSHFIFRTCDVAQYRITRLDFNLSFDQESSKPIRPCYGLDQSVKRSYSMMCRKLIALSQYR